jgi:hypothetical protein
MILQPDGNLVIYGTHGPGTAARHVTKYRPPAGPG